MIKYVLIFSSLILSASAEGAVGAGMSGGSSAVTAVSPLVPASNIAATAAIGWGMAGLAGIILLFTLLFFRWRRCRAAWETHEALLKEERDALATERTHWKERCGRLENEYAALENRYAEVQTKAGEAEAKVMEEQAKNREEQEKCREARTSFEQAIQTLTRKNKEIQQLLLDKVRQTDAWEREKEETYRETLRDFEALKKRHNAFFTQAIHEMRTPLSLILGSLGEVIHRESLDATVSSRLLAAYRNTLALQDLALQLRDARLGDDVANHWRIARYDMVEVTRQICDLFVDWIALNHVDFRINAQTPVLWIWMDRRKMEFVLRTLVSNALKNTFRYGRIVLDISVVRQVERDEANAGKRVPGEGEQAGTATDFVPACYCRFSVRDEGLDEKENTRLGLGQIADMAQVAGIEFLKTTSADPEGTTYTLFIPLGKRHLLERAVEFVEPDGDLLQLNEQQKEEINELIRVIPQPKVTGKHLLIVDDSDQIRWFLKHVFCKEYEISEARDGEEGLRLARERQPDIILCDVMMPVKDGFAVCRELKADAATRRIPLILLTAKVGSEDVITGLECGADDYITKPFDMEVLRSKVRNVCKRSEEMKLYYTAPGGIPPLSPEGEAGQASPAEGGWTLPAETSEQPDGKETPAALFMESVVETIGKHLDNPDFDAKVMAEALNMSLPTLYRKIKQYSDYSVLELTRTVRLRKAAALIRLQRYSIQEVSERVGFNDPATFRKRFVEQYGVTPSQYATQEESFENSRD